MSRIALRRVSALLLSLLFGTAASPSAWAGVVVTAVGSPGYLLADTHLFSAPIGTAGSGYVEFGQTQQALLPPPHHDVNPVLGIGPGTPHAGPYDQELGVGVAAGGFNDASSFTTDQFSNGKGIYMVFMLVAGLGSPTGASPDFASGPIIPNAIFPLTVSGGTYIDGTVNAVLADFQVPAINQVPGYESLDGHSHIPFFFADNFDFQSRPDPGSYEYRISLLDAAGNGYQIVADFQVRVVPEPATWALLAFSGLIVGGLARRRREHIA